MELSAKSIEVLTEVISGGHPNDEPKDRVAPYRTGSELTNFFRPLGFEDRQVKISRRAYTNSRLHDINGTDKMKQAVTAALDPRHFHSTDYALQDAAEYVRIAIRHDGYDVVKRRQKYEVTQLTRELVDVEADFEKIEEVDQEYLTEQIQKCQVKISSGDYDGAITNARSMVEAVLIGVEKDLENDAPEYSGDLLSLYGRVHELLNLDPSAEDLDTNLRQTLQGLISVINGIGGLRNRLSDSHASSYRPDKRHAKLVVNASKTFVEFVFETYSYQEQKDLI